MNTNYPPRAYRKDPLQEEIEKNIGTFNLTVLVEKDTELMNTFKHIPNFIAFKTILKKDNQVISIGSGSAVLNQYNKFLSRTVRFAYGSSIVDAVVRSVKVLDALSIMPNTQKENDLEGRDKQAFYGDEDMPQVATEKQRNFLTKLVNEQCDDGDAKEEYLKQLESPYLSKFECSELIQQLMPVK